MKRLFLGLLLSIPVLAQVPIIVDTLPTAAFAQSKVPYQWRQAITTNVCPNFGAGGSGGTNNAYCITLDNTSWLVYNIATGSFSYPGGTGFVLVSGGASWGVTVTNPLPRVNGGLNSSSPGTGILRDGTTPAASELSGDVVTAGTNATIVGGIKGVPLCTGFTPINNQVLVYTTGGSPNPCYSATAQTGIVTLVTQSGAPTSACTAPTTANLALSFDTTSLLLYYCNAATPVWRQFLDNGTGSGKSGAELFSGLTSGGVAFAAADIAGTAITYILPTTNGTTGQALEDNGVTTCGTYATGIPTTCHQLIWVTLTGGGNVSNSGTPANTQIAQWINATTIQGITSVPLANLPTFHDSCVEAWGGSGTLFALTTGDDAIVVNGCYNDTGATRTITAVKCLSDNGTNTTTVNPTFGVDGTGTTILSGALQCGSSNTMSSSGTVSNASWTTGKGIAPGMGNTLTGTHIVMIVEFSYAPF